MMRKAAATAPRVALALDQVLLDRYEVAKLLHISVETLGRMERNVAGFPSPVRVLGNSQQSPALWRTADVLDWVDTLGAGNGR